MTLRLHAGIAHLALLCCASLFSPEALAGETLEGRWDDLSLPLPGGEISGVGLEPGGDLWAVIGGKLFYWTGSEFRTPDFEGLEESPHPIHLFGGGDRPLVAAQALPSENRGRLYVLSDGRALFEIEYYQDHPHAPPSVAVSRAGQLFHWGDRFLAVRRGADWERIEAPLHHRETLVLETEAETHFYFNRSLLSVDHAGLVETREIRCPVVSSPGRNRIHGALWGDDRLFLFEDSTQEVFAYDLGSGEPVEVSAIDAFLERRRAHDLFRLPDGSLWILVFDFESSRFAWWGISRKGSLEPTGNTDVLGWRNLRHWQYPGSVLARADGEIWFGTPRDGIARWRGGETEIFDWRQGIEGEFRMLLDGPKGALYAASRQGVFRYDPHRPAAERPAWVGEWEEFRLASAEPLRDGEGRIWMFLAGRPGEVSRWDGTAWTHFAVPFSTRKVGRVLADDRGHLLVAMGAYPDGCFDVGPDGTAKFTNLHSLLVAAVAGGARRFFPEPSIRGCVVQPDGRIWFAYQGYHAVHLFDGERWDELPLREPIYDVFESAEGEIRIRTQRGRLFAYDRGQFLEVPSEAPADARAFTPGFHGGRWTRFPRQPAVRFLGTKEIPCDFGDTPLVDRQSSIEAILDDRAGNLWFDTGNYFGTRSVFVKRVESLEIRAADLPRKSGRSLALEPEVSFAGEEVEEALLFWRLDGGERRGGERRVANIVFPGEGAFEVEVAAMGPLGELTPRPLRWTVIVEADPLERGRRSQ